MCCTIFKAKNLRYLFKLLGTTSLTGIGDGTVTGAIKALEEGTVKNFSVVKRIVSGTGVLRIKSRYDSWTGAGEERQTIFIIGNSNYVPVYGELILNDKGNVKWSGTPDTPTAASKTGGYVELTFANIAYDNFLLISPDPIG